MAGQLSYYDILEVLPGASSDDVQHAYEVLMRVLSPDAISGAPSKVIAAADRARLSLDTAVRVLCDPVSRDKYDSDAGIRRTEGGLAGPVRVSSQGNWSWIANSNIKGGVFDDGALADAFGALADWLAPRPAAPRRVAVPDLRGLFVSPARRLIAAVDLRAELVRLTPNPMPVEGLVVDQSPRAGTIARRASTVVVQVWHPAKRPGRRA
jgi:curved DNA-binding protein CbpA